MNKIRGVYQVHVPVIIRLVLLVRLRSTLFYSGCYFSPHRCDREQRQSVLCASGHPQTVHSALRSALLLVTRKDPYTCKVTNIFHQPPATAQRQQKPCLLPTPPSQTLNTKERRKSSVGKRDSPSVVLPSINFVESSKKWPWKPATHRLSPLRNAPKRKDYW